MILIALRRLAALLPILFLHAAPASAASRLFQPPEGFIAAKDLPEDFQARVRDLRFDRKDAFEGSVIHTTLDRKLFNLGNDLHIVSRESTIRRRLLFREGEVITKDRLAETERILRTEEFLSDAILSVRPGEGGECDVLVTTFDQWTLVPAIGISAQNLNPPDFYLLRWDRIRQSEWLWSAGLFESNLVGTGTKVGAAVRHTLERDIREIVASNNNLTPQKLQVTAYAAWLSDGDSLLFSIGKPLLSRTDRYAFSVGLAAKEVSERIYFDANHLDALPPDLAKDSAGAAHLLRIFNRVATQEINASATRSFGSDLKLNAGPTFQFKDHYNIGGLGRADSALLPFAPLPASAAAPEQRTDALIGGAVSLYRYGFRTARNFRNLKWNESVETGWRLTSKAALNQEWLGAGDSDFRLSQEAQFTAFPMDAVYVNGSASWQSFLSPSGDLADGRADALWESAWREHPLTSTWLTASWSGLFATPLSQQLTLGEINGLAGYPSFYYAGQARFLATAEQRLFPEFELLTMVPAFAAYVTAGNTFPAWRDFDPADLHYSLGLGLRLGRSKSTQKVVQHINVNFPLGDKYLKGPVVSILARKSL